MCSLTIECVLQGDLGGVARQGCLVLCDVCNREYKLLQRFIPSVDTGEGGGLAALMGPLCETLIDMLRPLYIKVCICVWRTGCMRMMCDVYIDM